MVCNYLPMSWMQASGNQILIIWWANFAVNGANPSWGSEGWKVSSDLCGGSHRVVWATGSITDTQPQQEVKDQQASYRHHWCSQSRRVSLWHLDASTKWLIICRRHFQMHFFFKKFSSYFDCNFTKFASKCSIHIKPALYQVGYVPLWATIHYLNWWRWRSMICW